jgi:prephenate dehydrogenase
VPNRPGVVAEVALALGRAGVNILDMALYPASDMSSGTIALWIAGERMATEAQELVEGLGLTVARA